jgi:hypothetical protein
MPTYSIDGPGGKTYSIDGPEGATREQVIAKIKERLAEQNSPSAAGEFFKGVGRGVSNVAGAVAETLTGKNIREATSDLGAALSGDKEPKITPPYSAGVNKRLGLDPNPDADFRQRVAGSIGEAVADPLTYLGPGGPLLKAGGAVLGAAGGEGAGSVAKEFDLPELPARVVGGFLGGHAAGRAAGAPGRRAGANALLDEQELHDRSRAGYQAMSNSQVRIRPEGMGNLHNTVEKALRDDGWDETSAPQTFARINLLAQRRPTDHPFTLGQVINIHNRLGKTSNPGETAASQSARREMEGWLEQHMPPSSPLRNAMGDWSAYKKAEEIGRAGSVGRHRADVSGTGSNIQNTLRQEVRKILDSPKRVRGYSPEARAQMERIVSGTVWQNIERWLGRFAPVGLHSTMGAAFIAHILNAPLALAGAAGAYGAKKIGDVMTRRDVERLFQLALEAAPSNRAQAARNRATETASTQATRAQALRSAAPQVVHPDTSETLDNPSPAAQALENAPVTK